MLPGFGFTEFVVIGIVALVVVGPRDLPRLAKTLAGFMRQARSFAKDFQKSFDEMGRELELDDLRKEVEALRRGDVLADVKKDIRAIDDEIRTGGERPSIAPVHAPPAAAASEAPADDAPAPDASRSMPAAPPAASPPETRPETRQEPPQKTPSDSGAAASDAEPAPAPAPAPAVKSQSGG
jgi:sec-independent protein translocase protein TatB